MHVKQEIMKKLSGLGKRYKYPIMILCLGVLLMMVPLGGNREESPEAAAQETATAQDSDDQALAAFTGEVEAILGKISGAGQVRVLLTKETGGTSTYLMDESLSQSGDHTQRESKAVLVDDGSGEKPVTVRRTCATFRGAVVLSQGAENAGVTLAIKEAISSLTGLGMDRITVLKMD